MASQFQDLDLQDIQFLMETASQAQGRGADGEASNNGRSSYYRPDEHSHVFDDDDNNDDPTMVMSSSIDMQRAFPLINKVLPFEACLYHGILPLYIQGNELYLGMVELDDTESLDYARRMLSYLRYQLIPQTISSETHHQVLSAFLQQQSQKEQLPALPEPTVEQTASTYTGDATTAVNDLSEAPTASRALVPEEEITTQQQTDASTSNTSNECAQTLHLTEQDVLTDWNTIQQARLSETTKDAPEVKPTFLIGDGSDHRLAAVGSPSPAAEALETIPETGEPHTDTEIEPPSFALPGSALPELALEAGSPEQDWQSVSGKQFIHGLLMQMMSGGVGRLFLVRKIAGGQVLWTENGQTKLVIEQIASDQFRAAIEELKNLTHLPRAIVNTPVEVEIERFYQRQRVLLRLRITPKEHGEEATIQVLRGAALKFYQKHQINSLRRDTKSIAAQLRNKVLELGKRSHQDDVDRSTLPEIDRTIASLEEQLLQLKKLRHNLSSDPSED